MPSVMIIAGESSGELYGALLATAIRKSWQDVNILGIGGERMRTAGVDLISRISDAFGLVEAVKSLDKIKASFSSAVSALKRARPEVLVLIDYPDFNLKLAKEARKLGIKILYYVSPQVWAWRKGRVKQIAGLVDMMAVLLPFEEKIYKDAGVRCEFVGHPVMEEIEDVIKSAPPGLSSNGRHILPIIDAAFRRGFKASAGFDPECNLLSLLPGSRPNELEKLLPLMIDIVRQFRSDREINGSKKFQFCMPLAPNTDEMKYSPYLSALKQEGVVIKKGESVRFLAASDLAVVASGTATLQTALLEVPMVVVYKLSPLTFFLGKRIVKVSHISLINILAGNRDVVKELLQESATPEEVIKELKNILFVPEYRENMTGSFRAVKSVFTGKRPSERVADIVLELAGKKLKSYDA